MATRYTLLQLIYIERTILLVYMTVQVFHQSQHIES